MFVLTRPDVVRDLHRSFLDVGVDVVETDSFGTFPCVLAEYRLADRTDEIAAEAAKLARGSRPWLLDAGPAEVRRRIDGSRHEAPDPRADHLRRPAGLPTRCSPRGSSTAASICSLIETSYDMLQAKAAMQACRRAMATVGRQVPIQVQVTIELTGRMLLGTEIGAALTALEAMQPDVIGMNCATGPVEMHESLHHLVRALAHTDLRPPERRPALGGRRQDALRPHSRSARRRTWRSSSPSSASP